MEPQDLPTRKLIVCCDGTWNRRDSADAPTNVAKMARAIRPIDDQNISQLIYYHPGVGTGNWLDSMLGGSIGVGLSANVQSAYAFLVDNFNYGDQIFLFGFSRGAFTARSLAGFVGLVGLLQKTDMEYFSKVYEIYRHPKHRDALARMDDEAKVREALDALFPEDKKSERNRLIAALNNSRPTLLFFIGVWDTVGSLGIPWPLSWIGGSRYKFHNTDLSEHVAYAYHALAIDERRGPFRPTLWTRAQGRGDASGGRKQVFEQVWFAGCHSNVGGGYEDASLSDSAFLWMASKAASAVEESGERPLAFDDDYLKTKISSLPGALVNSKTGIFWWLPKFVRPIMHPPNAGRETCEQIHYSVLQRYNWPNDGSLEPYPYRPSNAAKLLAATETIITEPTDFEKRYGAPR